ncbi:terminase gpP N-terminus-related DNA-binding protein [Enterobacter sp. PTB]|uniref:terminase gpP N-terminus-related DNA-binding protein n=1 Tax=Enterobacter sp. PTB TaxID=3143437 RepID=UPI003DAA278F
MTQNDKNDPPRHQAKRLYLSGFSVNEIAERLSIKTATLYTWKKRDGWGCGGKQQAHDATLQAYLRLIELPPEEMTDRQLHLLDRYASLLATLNGAGDSTDRKKHDAQSNGKQ